MEALIKEQKLNSCSSLMDRCKGNFCTQDGTFMRREIIMAKIIHNLSYQKVVERKYMNVVMTMDLTSHLRKNCSELI